MTGDAAIGARGGDAVKGSLERERARRGRRALERQLGYQGAKSRAVDGHQAEYVAAMVEESRRVREVIERVRPIPADGRVLEVGSGAHGLIFHFDAPCRVGADPLAEHYASLFPWWQRRAPTVAALGNAPGDVGGDGQEGRGVPAPGEGHDTGRAQQGAEDDRLQGRPGRRAARGR